MKPPSRWVALAVTSALCAVVGAWLLTRFVRERSLLAFHKIDEVEITPTDSATLASLDPAVAAHRRLDAHVADQWKYFLDQNQVAKIFKLAPGVADYDPWSYTHPAPFQMRKTR